jgi:hypothetical protein
VSFRIYFNVRGKFPWSVDTGPGTPEYTTKKVSLVDVIGETVFDPSAGDNKNTPTAWVLVEEASCCSLRDMSEQITILGAYK